jgi:hypothetical protein
MWRHVVCHHTTKLRINPSCVEWCCMTRCDTKIFWHVNTPLIYILQGTRWWCNIYWFFNELQSYSGCKLIHSCLAYWDHYFLIFSIWQIVVKVAINCSLVLKVSWYIYDGGLWSDGWLNSSQNVDWINPNYPLYVSRWYIAIWASFRTSVMSLRVSNVTQSQ